METGCSFLSGLDVCWRDSSAADFVSVYITDIIIIMGTLNTHGITVKGRPASQVFSNLYRKERTGRGQRRKTTSGRFSSAEMSKTQDGRVWIRVT